MAFSAAISMLKNKCFTTYILGFNGESKRTTYIGLLGSWMYVVTQCVAMYVVMAGLL